MAKTQEELKELKEEYETLNKKLKELSDDELKLVIGGSMFEPEINDDAGFFILQALNTVDSMLQAPYYNEFNVIKDAFGYLQQAINASSNEYRKNRVACALQSIDSTLCIPELSDNLMVLEAKDKLLKAQEKMGI